MVETIFVLDRNKNVIGYLSNNGASPVAPFFDAIYVQELSNGSEICEFSTLSNAITSEILQLGNYIVFMYDNKYKMFQIMDTDEPHEEGSILISCYCEMAGLELLTDFCEPFTIEGNVSLFLNTVLQDTNWKLGKYSSSLVSNIQQVKVDKYTNVYKIIQDNIETFGGIEIEYRVEFDGNRLLGYYIDVYDNEERGNKTYKRFEYGENVKGITRKRNLYDFASAMIGVGKDNLTFKDIEWKKSKGNPADKPIGQDFIVDLEANNRFNKHGKYIKGLFENSEITTAQDLLLKSWEKLQEVKEPKFDYEVDLALTYWEYENIKIGDTVYVIDNDYNPPVLLEARVGKLELSLSDGSANKCTLSNYKEVKSKINTNLSSTIRDMVSKYFPITSSGIADGAIIDGKIDTVYYQQITADIVSASKVVCEDLIAQNIIAINGKFENLDAIYARIENLDVTYANIEDLKAVKAWIGTLNAGEIIADKLHATDADIIELKAKKADITDLTAINGNISNLTSEVANIKTLVNGNLTSDNIQSLVLTSNKVTVVDGFIKNAMIESLNASKINAGILNTNNVSIQSDDGSMLLQGNLQQFKDNNGNVRIQIGKDATGDFTFALYGADGQGQLITQDGIKSSALSDGLIVDSMINDDANISGSKIDIDSFFRKVNSDGTETLNSSKIKFSDTNQTLDIAFNSLKNKVETIEEITISGDLPSVIEQVTTNTTNIGIAQGKIETLISDTTITNVNGNPVKLKDDYSSLKQTVGGLVSTVGTHTTNISALTGKVTSVETQQAIFQQTLAGFSTTVSDISTNLENNYSTTSAMNSAINQKAGEITSSVSSSYQTKAGMSDYATASALSTVKQNADKISWFVKSGTSSSNMVLTDNLYSVLANNIMLGAKNVTIGDYTNLCQLNPHTNTGGNTVITSTEDIGQKVFRFGYNTTAGYYKFTFFTTTQSSFKKGDNFVLRFYGKYNCDCGFKVRATYSDGTYTNLGSVSISKFTTYQDKAIPLKLTNSIEANKTLTKISCFVETNNATGWCYMRDISLNRMTGGDLLVDGAIDGKTITGSIFKTTDGKLKLSDSGIIVNGGVFTLNTAGKVTCSNIDITGGTITLGNASSGGGTGSGKAFRVGPTGNVKIGGLTSYKVDGVDENGEVVDSLYYGGQIEFTSYGNGYFRHATNSSVYTRIGDGEITVCASSTNNMEYLSSGLWINNSSNQMQLTGGSIYGTGVFNLHGYGGIRLKADTGESLYLCTNGYNHTKEGSGAMRYFKNSDNNYVFRSTGTTGTIFLGTTTYPIGTVTAKKVNELSDRTVKKDIEYIVDGSVTNKRAITTNSITLKDMYDFVNNDLAIAKFKYIDDANDDEYLNFIAQDLIYNADGSDSKVGQFILNLRQYTEEEGRLGYNTSTYISVLAGALQIAIREIESLKTKLEYYDSYFNIAS